MKLPETEELILPVLKLLSDRGEYTLRQIVSSLAEDYKVDGSDDADDSAADAQFYSRVVGARSYLSHAKLIENPSRGLSKISPRGLTLLEEKPRQLNLDALNRYPEFVDYLKLSTSNKIPTIINNPTVTDLLDDLIESDQPLNGNHPLHDGAENGSADLYSSDSKDDKRKMTQRATPLKRRHDTHPNGPINGENPIMLSEEGFQSTFELFEQLKVSSQLQQHTGSRPRSVTQQTEGLSPAMFTLLSIMRYLENLFQHFRLYLIPFVLMMLAYAGSFFILSDEFVSRGVLFVQTDTLINQVSSIGEDNVGFFLSPSEQTAAEITELLNTDAFIRLIIASTPLEANMADGDKSVRETITDVRDSINVGITGSNNVEVTASWDDREVAWKTATATLDTFIEWKINSDKRDSFAAREFLEQLVPQYENDYLGAFQDLEEYLIQHPEPFRGDRPEIEQLQIEQLQSAISTAGDRYDDASERLEQIRLEEVIVEGKTRQAYNIVDAPAIPVEEEGGLLRKLVTASIFISLGILLSLLAVLSSTLLDRSMRFPVESPSTLGLPVLSSVKMVPNIDELTQAEE